MTSPSPLPGDHGDVSQPVADLSKAPLPTTGTLHRRRNVPYQLTRFVVFNARIMRMVLRGETRDFLRAAVWIGSSLGNVARLIELKVRADG